MTEKRKYAKGGKHIRHVIRVTDLEEAQLQAKATSVGVTIARFMFDSAMGTVPAVKNKVVVDEVFGIRRQVQGIATNLNQLTMDHNSGTTFEADIYQAIAEVLAFVKTASTWLENN